MGEYEPDDSRDVTQSTHQAPGEPPRTGPREDEARARAQEEQEDLTKKKTARDATGQKQPGFAGGHDESDEEPPLAK
jgi:hypothetical protein